MRATLLAACLGLAACSAPPPAPVAPGFCTQEPADPLGRLLCSGEAPPRDVRELRARLVAAGAAWRTALVANRGFHNTASGSLSFFEMAQGALRDGTSLEPGDLFIGHFTALAGDEGKPKRLVLDQTPAANALLVEAIAWDPRGLYAFYELRGDGSTGVWHRRGDSIDIVRDVREVHRKRAAGQPIFGERLRCSGCHLAGGPIMKELAAPHNDWWTVARPVPLQQEADPDVAGLLAALVDAEELAAAVRRGLDKLGRSPSWRTVSDGLSLRTRLRPLFCPLEVNFESDPTPLEMGAPAVQVPAGFLFDPRLSAAGLEVPRALYDQALARLGAGFPETTRPDGDRPWLSPVKAWSDIAAVQQLVDAGVIDDEFVADVLAVDAGEPMFSAGRCGLLGAVPDAEAPGWQESFADAAAALGSDAGKELQRNRREPGRDRTFHRAAAAAMVALCRDALKSPAAGEVVLGLTSLLGQRRKDVAAAEISQNPRGQILEPGFRVIFPELKALPPARRGLAEICAPPRR